MRLRLTPDERERVRRTGVRWMTTLDLRPGTYSLRVGTEATTTNRSGAVFLDIDVPEFKDNLRIDGLAVTSLPAALTLTSGTPPTALGLPGPPTTARTFIKGDVITVSAEVGAPRNFTQGTVELTVKSQAADATAAPLLQRSIDLTDRAAVDQPRAWAVDTAGLGAGQFVLRLTVRDKEGAAERPCCSRSSSDSNAQTVRGTGRRGSAAGTRHARTRQRINCQGVNRQSRRRSKARK